jgi:hypothetical protein
MGTLLSGAAGVCMLAGLLLSTHTTVHTVANESSRLRATANYFNNSVDSDELRVIETRLVSADQGMLVYGNSTIRDSVLVEARFLAELHPGDLLSDGDGTIDR